jgi:hypothetical protein
MVKCSPSNRLTTFHLVEGTCLAEDPTRAADPLFAKHHRPPPPTCGVHIRSSGPPLEGVLDARDSQTIHSRCCTLPIHEGEFRHAREVVRRAKIM